MRNMRSDAAAENVQQGASEEEIGTIPTVKVAEGDVEGDCAICLEPYAAGDELRKLPCDHTFHKPCLDNWLMINGTCPYCRAHYKGREEADPQPQCNCSSGCREESASGRSQSRRPASGGQRWHTIAVMMAWVCFLSE